MSNFIKSPINYTGSKYRLLKTIIPFMPKNINTFVDLFCGACNVGLNINANKVVFNDYIPYIPQLFNLWKNKGIEEVNNKIDNTIKQFNLSPTNKQTFEKFREHYNDTRDIEDLFVLLCYSFNYQMRFNSKHEFNGSFGKEASTMNDSIRNNVNILLAKLHENNYEFTTQDFRAVDLTKLKENDFVYLDPPYNLSCGVYQDGKRGFKGWHLQDDLDLFELCNKLNKKGIKFGLSNMIESKGKIFKELQEWSKKYNIHYLSKNYNGANYHRQDSKDIEVYVCNYEIEE